MADELSDLAKTRKDLLWGMYTDVRAHARHAETLRSSMVSFMILVASVLVAVIANDRRINASDIALSLAIALVGLIGFAFAASYTELHERNRKRAMRIRLTIDDEFFSGGSYTIESLLDDADADHETGRLYRWSRRFAGSTQRFWFVLPGLTAVTGLTLCIIAF
jgi:hypothetical protein